MSRIISRKKKHNEQTITDAITKSKNNKPNQWINQRIISANT